MNDADRPQFSVSVLAAQVGGDVRGNGDRAIRGLNTLADASAGDLTFIINREYASRWPRSQAAAAVVNRNLESILCDQAREAADSRPLIFVDDAEQAMIRLLEQFAPPEPLPDSGVHPSAVIHPEASVGRGGRIGPHASVDRGCRIGDGVILHAGVRLYADVSIGDGSILHANVVVRHGCRIGRRVILHQNVSIGADGFGYRPAPSGAGLLKMPHIGNVIIEDEVEIGANTCVDRAKFGSTIIGAGTKIDNLCQVAHNCRIGRCCVIAGHVGFSGSVTVGDGVQIAGQVGVADHIKIGHRVKIGAQAGVMHDIPDDGVWVGTPAVEAPLALRQAAAIRKLPELLRRLKTRD